MNLLPRRTKSKWEFVFNFVLLAIGGLIFASLSITRDPGFPLWAMVLGDVIWVVAVVWEVIELVRFIRDRRASERAGNLSIP